MALKLNTRYYDQHGVIYNRLINVYEKKKKKSHVTLVITRLYRS